MWPRGPRVGGEAGLGQQHRGDGAAGIESGTMTAPIALRLALAGIGVGLLLGPPAAHGGPEAKYTTITGVVRDREGNPVSRAWLQVEGRPNHPDTRPKDPSVERVFTGSGWWDADAQGRFEIDNAPEGPGKLRAVAGDWTLFPQAGTVVDIRGGTRDLVITVETGREIRLKVEPYDPRTARERNGARLVLSHSKYETEFRWAPIAADGSVRFVQLPDNQTFEVWGHATADLPFKESGLVPSKEVRTIRARPGLTISGKILPAKVATEDGPVVRAWVHAGFEVAQGRVATNGTFVIPGLPGGEYTVFAELRSERSAGVSKVVRAGATDVVLDFDNGSGK